MLLENLCETASDFRMCFVLIAEMWSTFCLRGGEIQYFRGMSQVSLLFSIFILVKK